MFCCVSGECVWFGILPFSGSICKEIGGIVQFFVDGIDEVAAHVEEEDVVVVVIVENRPICWMVLCMNSMVLFNPICTVQLVLLTGGEGVEQDVSDLKTEKSFGVRLSEGIPSLLEVPQSISQTRLGGLNHQVILVFFQAHR